jgi:tetratricopeptide (TPR) repeat protein
MKKIFRRKTAYLLIAANIMGVIACKDEFLDVPVTATLNADQLQSKAAMEGLLIGAYAPLGGKGLGYNGGASNWVMGSIRGGDANKGTNAGDFNTLNPVEKFETDLSNPNIQEKWNGPFEGVARVNTLLAALAKTNLLDTDKKRIAAEARFLRGHYYFELRRNFKKVPYVDESTSYGPELADKEVEDKKNIPNNEEIWPKIEADFKAAYDGLDETYSQPGRANKWAAAAYLGKTYLYQKKYPEAKAMFDEVITNGKTTNGKKYDLVKNYADLFKASNDNHEESIFAVQAAVNTGDVQNANQDFVLNFPHASGSLPGGCCGFFAPSFELTNSFRTDASGLPLLDGSYKAPANELKNDQGIATKEPFVLDPGPVDPRLDHSVGRRGIPYLDWGPHPGMDWIRDQAYAGPYAPKKFVYYRADIGKYQDGSSWTPGYTAMNVMIIRFADVLLMAAEAEIEAGSLEQAREYINRVRARAANPAGFVKNADGTDAANYKIGQYEGPWTKEQATQAVRFERKLELSGEGHRFYDLVRWGIAEPTLNAYFAYEKTKLPTHFVDAKFTANQDEYLPIPQRQLDLQKGILQQNEGY